MLAVVLAKANPAEMTVVPIPKPVVVSRIRSVGQFVAPWDWRRGKRLKAANYNEAGKCLIKGNIGRNGVRIHHIPGGAYYNRTRIDQQKGERWFCSEAEAREAGWRRSKR